MWNRNIETFLGCDAAYEAGHIVPSRHALCIADNAR